MNLKTVPKKRMMKISRRWIRKAEIYKIFARPWKHVCAFTEIDAIALYKYESGLGGDISIDTFNQSANGYAVGKKWCDVQVSAWLNDFKSNRTFARLCLERLYQDKTFPEWWLDSIFLPNGFERMVEDIKTRACAEYQKKGVSDAMDTCTTGQ